MTKPTFNVMGVGNGNGKVAGVGLFLQFRSYAN